MSFNISSSVVQPLFGVMSDRFKAPWFIPLGCFLAGFGMASTGFAKDYMVLLFAVLISGFGVAAYHPEGSKFARFAIGFAIGPILAGFFYKLFGLYGTLGFLLINGVMAFFLWFYLP